MRKCIIARIDSCLPDLFTTSQVSLFCRPYGSRKSNLVNSNSDWKLHQLFWIFLCYLFLLWTPDFKLLSTWKDKMVWSFSWFYSRWYSCTSLCTAKLFLISQFLSYTHTHTHTHTNTHTNTHTHFLLSLFFSISLTYTHIKTHKYMYFCCCCFLKEIFSFTLGHMPLSLDLDLWKSHSQLGWSLSYLEQDSEQALPIDSR
jgi:hypothetical protein